MLIISPYKRVDLFHSERVSLERDVLLFWGSTALINQRGSIGMGHFEFRNVFFTKLGTLQARRFLSTEY